jgi:hypothetical protein
VRNARWLIVAVAFAALFVSVGGAAGSAQPQTRTVTLGIGQSCSPLAGQICMPVTTAGSFTSIAPLKVVFTLAAVHCSNVAVRLFVDGTLAATTGFAPPGVSTENATVPWPNDGRAHTLGYEGEGEVGGCNAGILVVWNGTLAVTYTPKKPGTHEISGTVFVSCGCGSTRIPLANEAIEVRGRESFSTITDIAGHYSVQVPKGSYILTPGLGGGYTFSPSEARRDVQDADVSDVNFSGCAASSLLDEASAAASRAVARSAAATRDLTANSCYNGVVVSYVPGQQTMTVGWRFAPVCTASAPAEIDKTLGITKVFADTSFPRSSRDVVKATPGGGITADILGSDGVQLLSVNIAGNGTGTVDVGSLSLDVHSQHPNHVTGDAGAIESCMPHSETLSFSPYRPKKRHH